MLSSHLRICQSWGCLGNSSYSSKPVRLILPQNQNQARQYTCLPPDASPKFRMICCFWGSPEACSMNVWMKEYRTKQTEGRTSQLSGLGSSPAPVESILQSLCWSPIETEEQCNIIQEEGRKRGSTNTVANLSAAHSTRSLSQALYWIFSILPWITVGITTNSNLQTGHRSTEWLSNPRWSAKSASTWSPQGGGTPSPTASRCKASTHFPVQGILSRDHRLNGPANTLHNGTAQRTHAIFLASVFL